jgi:hypothetical protein
MYTQYVYIKGCSTDRALSGALDAGGVRHRGLTPPRGVQTASRGSRKPYKRFYRPGLVSLFP